jgi:hypothetical protein
MSDQALAQIIPFPSRPATAAKSVAHYSEGQERLARALASLNAALAGQRMAMATWCGALAELKQTTGNLHGGLQRYHDDLGVLGTRVALLKEEAIKLEAWADKTLGAEA